MPDRENVIKGLEYHLKELTVGKTCFECPYCGDNPCEIQLIADALALLKEQEAVVRCMYCKRRSTYDCPVYVGGDGMCSEPDDWYCADGERK